MIGRIATFAGPLDTARLKHMEASGWIPCWGQTINRAKFSELYDAIGDYWGEGDGIKTFEIPDLRGQFLRGVSHDSTVDPDAASRENAFGNANFANQVGSTQSSSIGPHEHDYSTTANGTLYDNPHNTPGKGKRFGTVGARRTGGPLPGTSETRPTNKYVEYLIRFARSLPQHAD